MRKLFEVFFLIVSSLAASAASASAVTGTVSQFGTSATSGSLFYFSVVGSISGRPNCNSNNAFVINASTAAGQAAREVVLMASEHGFTVIVSGTGGCSMASGYEDVGSINVKPAGGAVGAVAICISAGFSDTPECSCNSGKYLIPKQYTGGGGTCTIKAENGSACSAVGSSMGSRSYSGTCCLCAP